MNVSNTPYTVHVWLLVITCAMFDTCVTCTIALRTCVQHLFMLSALFSVSFVPTYRELSLLGDPSLKAVSQLASQPAHM